jgi:hypothetical protein
MLVSKGGLNIDNGGYHSAICGDKPCTPELSMPSGNTGSGGTGINRRENKVTIFGELLHTRCGVIGAVTFLEVNFLFKGTTIGIGGSSRSLPYPAGQCGILKQCPKL